jgi:hypothetical protein
MPKWESLKDIFFCYSLIESSYCCSLIEISYCCGIPKSLFPNVGTKRLRQ